MSRDASGPRTHVTVEEGEGIEEEGEEEGEKGKGEKERREREASSMVVSCVGMW